MEREEGQGLSLGACREQRSKRGAEARKEDRSGQHGRRQTWGAGGGPGKLEKKALQGQELGWLRQMLMIGQLIYGLRTDFEIGHVAVTGHLDKSNFTAWWGQMPSWA